ncbi:MAG: hypothetical protein JWM34_1632 [Ilumatobacteraceae bacterium]|nr:hypothetical protein [Ilumatobacteraceae bacterium]
MTTIRRCVRHDDRGAALILAIGFVLMVGAISAGLASLATSSLNNRATLEGVRNREYAADAAVQLAIGQVRGVAGSALSACATAASSTTVTVNSVTIRVEWKNACGTIRVADGTIVAQHDVIFTACENTGAACTDAALIIRAQINFQQLGTGAVTKTFVQSWNVAR